MGVKTMSNTAVPFYYGMYREAVLRGDIPINKEIELEMFRIDDLIADPNVYYDRRKVEGFVKFCEREMTLGNGENLKLLPIFKVWAEQLLGWYHYVDEEYFDEELGRWSTRTELRRRINKQYLIVARGAAKSMYAALLQAYFLNVDRDTTHQICTAPTMKQADEVMSPIRTAITRSRGPFFQFLTAGSIQNTTGDRFLRQKLFASKRGIENTLTGSLIEVRPMSINKLQGLGTKINTVDEWLSGDVREDVIGALEQGAGKTRDWVIVAISSEGVVRNGAGDDIKMELAKILKGDYDRPDTSIWHYKLDSKEEVDEGLYNPSVWLKANPNIGKTVTYEAYKLDVEKAKANPSAKNDIFAKRFGIPMEGYTFFFSYEETLPHKNVRYRAYQGMACAMGADLSQGDDFCAFTFLFPLRNGKFGVKTQGYITRRTLDLLPGTLRSRYQLFINEGTLTIMEGTVLDMDNVFDDLLAHIHDNDYDVRAMGYDPYNAPKFIERWKQMYGDYGLLKVIQGAKTESVPLGEIKILSEDGMLVFDEELMSYTMGNATVLEDTNGNRKLSKHRRDEKIDNVAAMMDAYIAFKAFKEEF